MALIDLLKPKETANVNQPSKTKFSILDLPPGCIDYILMYTEPKDWMNFMVLSKDLHKRFITRLHRSIHISQIKFKNNSIAKYSTYIREIDASRACVYPKGSLNLYRLIRNNPNVTYHLNCPSSFLFDDEGNKKYANCVIDKLTICYRSHETCILEDEEVIEKLKQSNALSKVKAIRFCENLRAAKNLFPLLKDQLTSISIHDINSNYLKKPIENIMEFKNLTSLKLDYCYVRHVSLQHIFNKLNNNIKYLDVSTNSNPEDGEKAPKLYINSQQCPNLQELRLGSIKYVIVFQGAFNQLTTLTLKDYKIKNLKVDQSNFTKLRQLKLINYSGITGQFIKMVLCLSNLTSLELDSYSTLDYLLIKEIYPNTNFKSNIIKLSLKSCRLDDYFLWFLINSCQQLDILYLNNCSSMSSQRSILLNQDKKYKLSLRKLELNRYELEEEFMEWIIENSPLLHTVKLTSVEGKWVFHCMNKFPKVNFDLEF